MNRRTAFLSIPLFALTLGMAMPAQAKKIRPPDVPAALAVPDGNRVFLVGHAIGSQNYVCLPAGAGFAWTLFTPEATLSRDDGKQVATHFFSPNPDEANLFRPTWLDSKDSSTVWAKLHAQSSDAAYVAPGAIAWFLLDASGWAAGPNGGDTFTHVTYIQRVNTSAGVAPAGGCAAAADIGKKAIEPYSADYYFYRADDDD